MLASLADAPLDDPQLVYEPKYDGIRAVVEVAPASGTTAPVVRLWSRLGHDKTAAFPEIAGALERWSRHLSAPVVVDGEIVALDREGHPTGFQQLQGRIHLDAAGDHPDSRVAFIAFDLLCDGTRDLRPRPLSERRALLERLFGQTGSPTLRLSEQVQGSGRQLYERALASGWEGLIAKHVNSRYTPGRRTPDWRKLKIVREQEFVVGGWTDPRGTRQHFGALLLGVYPPSSTLASARRTGRRRAPPTGLSYVGHTGSGFDDRELERVMRRLEPLATPDCPFAAAPDAKGHWVRPVLVAQVKFTEWTADGRLRHPVYLGLRDDKRPEDVHREPEPPYHRQTTMRAPSPPETPRGQSNGIAAEIVEELRAIEASHRAGVLHLPDGDRLNVGNLHKVFWPDPKLTKGDLLRYYARIAPCLLPVVADRPLVMKRFPNGIAGKAFYQQRAPEDVPEGVRVERVTADPEQAARLVGGTLKTLLYMAQLGAISQDPWFSRVGTPRMADQVALDLDPMPGVTFARVLDVARWIRDELDALGVRGFPKTSGADGLHIFLPLQPDTPYEAGLLFCQIVATVVAQKHPGEATVERAVRIRGRRVYIDYLQNIVGKTLAGAYSARASEYAGVSTPVTWAEIDAGIRREAFTIETVPERVQRLGDLWEPLRSSRGIDLSRAASYVEARFPGRQGV